MDSAGGTMSAVPQTDGQARLPKRIAPTGKVLKPARQEATSISIPSRYRTIVYSSNESKGFNSRVSRFPAPEINSNPGPGTYSLVHGPLENTSVSLSNRGTGGCATLKKRFSTMRLQSLGPGSYNPLPVENRRDFSQAGCSSAFQNPIAATVFDPKKQTPAPNAYSPRAVYCGGQNKLVTGEAVFKSKTGRSGNAVEKSTHPSPTRYDVNDKILHRASYSYNSVFKSKSQRDQKKQEKAPGPADYNVNSSIGAWDPMAMRRSLYTYKGKNALLISAPALPRHPSPDTPGPGYYNFVDSSKGREKLLGPDATFRSSTGRWLCDGKMDKLQDEPGPGSYNPAQEEKRSYFYNVYRKWV